MSHIVVNYTQESLVAELFAEHLIKSYKVHITTSFTDLQDAITAWQPFVAFVLLPADFDETTPLHVQAVIRHAAKSTKVAIVADPLTSIHAHKLLTLRAHAYLSRRCSLAQLNAMLEQLATSQIFIDPLFINQRDLVYLVQTENDINKLTKRENEVIHLLSQGYTNRKISETLHISLDTTKTHVSNILRKLGLSNNREIIVFALTNGIVSLRAIAALAQNQTTHDKNSL